MRELSEFDKNMLAKLAPELEGATGPAPGHDFQFILLPVSHRFAESPEDFASRIDKLNDDELNYLIDLIKSGKEDVRSLSEGDFDAIVEVVGKRFSEEKARELIDR